MSVVQKNHYMGRQLSTITVNSAKIRQIQLEQIINYFKLFKYNVTHIRDTIYAKLCHI